MSTPKTVRDRMSEAMESEEVRPYIETYGVDATKIVVDGYSNIHSVFELTKERGVISKGSVLVEKIHSSSWQVPPLLSPVELRDFQRFNGTDSDVFTLQSIWYILENVCDERRLVPSLRLVRATGQVEARLTD